MFFKKNNRGFTMAETLLTVAIIAILTGTVFIGVVNYMRAMAQLERDGIAKEIFISAQNHLTMAESQGFLGRSDFGAVESAAGGEGAEICYFTVNGPDDFGEASVLGVMLPFASIEENIRVGGSYIVRYQKQPALVLDVFYATKSGTRYGKTLGPGDYETLLGLRDTAGENHKADRRSYGSEKSVIGWYGGEEAQLLEKGKRLEMPLVEVVNAEKLTAYITDPNDANLDASLKLVITGELSGKQKVYSLNVQSMDKKNIVYDNISHRYTVTLDDVTVPGMHFSDLFEGDGFIPGEDIAVQAVSFSNKVLTNVANSAVRITNSLYAEIADSESDPGTKKALVGNFRHLENLDRTVSNVNGERAQIQVTGAEQTSDLDWEKFQEAIGTGAVSIYDAGAASGTKAGCFHPVSSPAALTYEGKGHRITGVVVDTDGDAGLFGHLPERSAISDLMLQDFTVTGTGNAGALLGSADNTVVTNIVAWGKESLIIGGGSTGGLIGSLSGGRVTGAGAALLVTGNGQAAGGFMGSASGVNITACYAGGHTTEGRYTPEQGFNVTCTGGLAGGFIGDAGNCPISSCYSTCSVLGQAPGGFLGSGDGSVSSCYATGLVRTEADNEEALQEGGEEGGAGQSTIAVSTDDESGTGEGGETELPGWDTPAGAFASRFGGSAFDCGYLEIVNEKQEDNRFAYLTALGNREAGEGIIALDTDTEAYSSFLGTETDRVPAYAYDGSLIQRFQGRYGLQSLAALGAELEDGWFVQNHYGDWPTPEFAFVNN